MVSFTTLLNRAQRRFIDKYLKKRYFGACEACDKRTLLINATQISDDDTCEWDLCEACYNNLVTEEIE